MKESVNKKEQTLLSIYAVLPVMTLYSLSEYFTDDATMRILYSAAFGGIGGVIGYELYRYLNQRKWQCVSLC